jgi:death-on-curing protein
VPGRFRWGLRVDEITFLTLGDVVEIHSDQLARYGGLDGFLDRNVVESALAQPQATMFGQFLHADIAEMAAAYLFHFAASQGFVDGNKRTAAVCAGVFLARNGYRLACTDEELYVVTMAAANNQLQKPRIADWIRDHLAPQP